MNDDSKSGMNENAPSDGVVDAEPMTIAAVAMDAVQRLAEGAEHEKPNRSRLRNRKTLDQEPSKQGKSLFPEHPPTANQIDGVQVKRKRGRPRKSNTDNIAKVSNVANQLVLWIKME